MKLEIQERIFELLADEAIFGLEGQERSELESLRAKHPEAFADDSFALAAAAFQVAAGDPAEDMPEFIKNRISDQADDYWRETYGSEEQVVIDSAASQPATRISISQWLGWAVAGAASVALAVTLWSGGVKPAQVADNETPGTEINQKKVPTVSEKREMLLASAPNVRSEWSSPQEDLKVEGDVVWSDVKQEGYMRFRGLPVNDRSKETYQLWIFDKTQDEATPVDGGVFDVDQNGEAIVPIDAKLKVEEPKAFAVTVEKPGGVVVSKREKIVALAKVA